MTCNIIFILIKLTLRTPEYLKWPTFVYQVPRNCLRKPFQLYLICFFLINSEKVKKVEDQVEKIIKEGNDVKVKVNAEINLTSQKQGKKIFDKEHLVEKLFQEQIWIKIKFLYL